MIFIKPSEIAAKIMTLLDESDEFVLFVSPYIKIAEWPKLLKRLEQAKARGINIHFIIRDEESNWNSFQELDSLGISYSSISRLHCKFYLSEKEVIVTSMNLHKSSDDFSLDIGYQTSEAERLYELKDFSQRFLQFDFQGFKPTTTVQKIDFLPALNEELNKRMNKSIHIKEELNGSYLIQTGANQYTFFIWNARKQNRLRINGILSGNEYSTLLKSNSLIKKLKEFELEIYDRYKSRNSYPLIWATSTIILEADSFERLNSVEVNKVIELIAFFVIEVDAYKLEVSSC